MMSADPGPGYVPLLNGLDDLRQRSDHTIVQLWLAERGLVAVERGLMERVAALDLQNGQPLRICYQADKDRYYTRSDA